MYIHLYMYIFHVCMCVYSEGGLFDGEGHIADDEEILIHTTINEMYDGAEEESSPVIDSKIDPYADVHYGSLHDELNAVVDVKCVASATKLKELVGATCRQPGCFKKLRSIEVLKTCGYALKLEWTCEAKHRGFWYSSSTYAAGFSINHAIETALLLAGMNYSKFLRFCHFVHLVHSSPSSFFRNQRLYAAPAIHLEYVEMRNAIIDDVKLHDEVILCGDGRMDSPGFSATKATYSFMEEQGSGRVVSMEHGDKRQVHTFIHIYM